MEEMMRFEDWRFFFDARAVTTFDVAVIIITAFDGDMRFDKNHHQSETYNKPSYY